MRIFSILPVCGSIASLACAYQYEQHVLKRVEQPNVQLTETTSFLTTELGFLLVFKSDKVNFEEAVKFSLQVQFL